MRKLILVPFFVALFCIFFSVASANAAETTYGNENIFYGQHFQKMTGDLTSSGVAGIATREAYVNRWQGKFNENITNTFSTTLTKMDNYNIIESEASDNFGGRRGYMLLPIRQPVITQFIKSLNGNDRQAQFIWNKIKDADFSYYGYFELNGTLRYYRTPEIVAMMGGKWVNSTFQPSGDHGKVNGTATFYLSPYPKINSVKVVNNELIVDFKSYGHSTRNVELTITNGSQSKTYTYYGVTNTTYAATFNKSINDFATEVGKENLKVILHDGFGRYDEKPFVVPKKKNVCENPKLVFGGYVHYPIYFGEGVPVGTGIGGNINWYVDFQANRCLVLEGALNRNQGDLNKHETTNEGEHEFSKEITVWKWMMTKAKNGVYLQNTSKTSEPMRVYMHKTADYKAAEQEKLHPDIMHTGKEISIVKQYTLKKGEKVFIEAPTDDTYYLTFPTPNQVEGGFWSDKKHPYLGYADYPQTTEYPENAKIYINQAIQEAKAYFGN
ncbi:MAG TPA: hypothetical protein GXX18_06235 [Bacillales bacterium]|nr:hypothetical protein [Bacillales bacterium]